MNIMKKIEERRTFIQDNKTGKGKDLAERISDAGVQAILAGMKNSEGEVTKEWKELMEFFANNDKELERLCGQEQKFNESPYGLKCLAYIAGNSTCTVRTATMTGTGKNFDSSMKKNLDADF